MRNFPFCTSGHSRSFSRSSSARLRETTANWVLAWSGHTWATTFFSVGARPKIRRRGEVLMYFSCSVNVSTPWPLVSWRVVRWLLASRWSPQFGQTHLLHAEDHFVGVVRHSLDGDHARAYLRVSRDEVVVVWGCQDQCVSCIVRSAAAPGRPNAWRAYLPGKRTRGTTFPQGRAPGSAAAPMPRLHRARLVRSNLHSI